METIHPAIGSQRLALLCFALGSLQAAPVVQAAAPGGKPHKPTVSLVTEMQAGDVACYISLQDDNGKAFEEMADFDICALDIIGRRVKLDYLRGQVLAPSCGGNPDCKKTRKVPLVVAAVVIDPKPPRSP